MNPMILQITTMKFHTYLTLFILLFLQSSSVFGQFKDEKLIKAEVVSFTKIFDDVEVKIKLSATGCEVPKVGFAHVSPTIKLVSSTNKRRVYYEQSPIFISVNKSTCKNGNFVDSTSLKIPDHHFTVGEEYVLEIRLYHDKKNWLVYSRPFTTKDMKINTPSIATYIRTSNTQCAPYDRGLNISFNYSSNSSTNATAYVKFFLNGRPCNDSIYTSIASGDNQIKNIQIPYTNLYIPPGAHTLSYKVYAETFNLKQKELFSGTCKIQQPQLYLMYFQSKNADIDVAGMDQGSSLVRIFSPSKGSGNGDAYYVIRNAIEQVFVSSEAINSGKIKDHRDVIQIYPNEQLKVIFYDKDVMTKDFIASFDFKPKLNESHAINVRRGKILNFDFSYRTVAVTANNISKVIPKR